MYLEYVSEPQHFSFISFTEHITVGPKITHKEFELNLKQDIMESWLMITVVNMKNTQKASVLFVIDGWIDRQIDTQNSELDRQIVGWDR